MEGLAQAEFMAHSSPASEALHFMAENLMKHGTGIDAPRAELIALAGGITAAYLRGNPLLAVDIPRVISAVFGSLLQLGRPEPQEEPQRPAVPIRKSVTAEYIVCLEDGRKLKMLKRHLRTTYGMTPEQYRAKWDLPPDYPMVAPAYAELRSEFARAIGLGRHRAAPEPEPQPVPAPAKRARRKAIA